MNQNPRAPRPGSPIDLAPFGRVRYFYGADPRNRRFVDAERVDGMYAPSEPDQEGRRHLGLWFEDPRDIYRLVVEFDPGSMPDPDGVRAQYWRSKWPFAHRDLLRGAHRGWIGRDDHYRGEWTTAICNMKIDGARVEFEFCHLDLTEVGDARALESAEDYNARFRCALQFRLLFPEGSAPRVRSIEAHADGEWRACEADVFGVAHDSIVEAYNGYVTRAEDAEGALRVGCLCVPGRADDFPHRRTVITVRDDEHPFSFCPADLDAGPIWIEDFGILVRPEGDHRDPEVIVEEIVGAGAPAIYDRISAEPEQTLQRAMAETPRLRPAFQHAPRGRYCPLGCEGGRQRFGLRYNANVFVDKKANKPMGRDLVDLLWSGISMDYRFATGDYPDFREREGACEQSWSSDGAPIITSVWVDRDIEFTQTAFAAYLREDTGDYFSKRGDEDIVLLVRFQIRNIARDARTARLWLQSSPFERVDYSDPVLSAHARLIQTEKLQSDELAARVDRPDIPHTFNWVDQPYETPLIRCRVDCGKGRGSVRPLALDREGPAGIPTAFHYSVDLAGSERDDVTFVIPYCALIGDEGRRTLQAVDYNHKLRDVREFWTSFVDSGMQIRVPDRMIEDFFRFVPVHVAITATKDPGSGEYVVPAATFTYGACGNEAVIQIRQLDYRGHHKQAEKYLDGLLLVQGAYSLDGNFQSKEGALQGISFYNGKPLGAPFSYNTDHGFILWMLSEHYFLTRDKTWLTRVAPNIVAGCDFITRERQATKREEDGRRVPEYGLLPAGHLEDNDEWRHWFAVNAHACLGIEWASQSLAEIDHPDAPRLAAEAADYKADILAAVERSRIESPVVRLPDNTAIPHIPTRTDIRGPEWGWFREGAYGPAHLIDGGVIEPCDQRATWVMKYLEDLVFPDRDLGRPIDIEKRWFSQAGVTIQANLLNNGTAYVRRDQPKHAVRALFNDFAASIYPDVLVFTEHPVVQLGRGVGPYYKTPDECGMLNLLRACLVIEEGDTLYLARAAPVSWLTEGETVEVRGAATWFGPVSYSIYVTAFAVEAVVKPPRRNPPSKLALRLRRADGRTVREVTVNGSPAQWDADRELAWLPVGGDDELVVKGIV